MSSKVGLPERTYNKGDLSDAALNAFIAGAFCCFMAAMVVVYLIYEHAVFYH